MFTKYIVYLQTENYVDKIYMFNLIILLETMKKVFISLLLAFSTMTYTQSHLKFKGVEIDGTTKK